MMMNEIEKFKRYVNELSRKYDALEKRRGKLKAADRKSVEQVQVEDELRKLDKVCGQIDEFVAKKLPLPAAENYGSRKVGSRNTG